MVELPVSDGKLFSVVKLERTILAAFHSITETSPFSSGDQSNQRKRLCNFSNVQSGSLEFLAGSKSSRLHFIHFGTPIAIWSEHFLKIYGVEIRWHFGTLIRPGQVCFIPVQIARYTKETRPLNDETSHLFNLFIIVIFHIHTLSCTNRILDGFIISLGY